MIVLDADVLIGLLDEDDAHHDAARDLLTGSAAEELGAATLTIAEALVVPARARREQEGWSRLRALGIKEVTLPAGSAPGLAEVRASTGLRTPDCVALHAARSVGCVLASFDDRLRRGAEAAGIEVLP